MIKILVVDDEAGICDSIKQIFTYIGFSVFTATTAKKALSVFEKEKPKIIFLDIMMPDINGLDLLKQIKKADPASIVIMVTASQEEKDKEKALQLGASEFITKPFSRNYLRDVVVQKIKDVMDKGGHMQKPSILIVDDEKSIREGLRDFILPRYECNIDLAGTGEEAIEKVSNAQPDVIFLDVKMPGISGLEAIEKIKKISPHSKIIIISAWKSAEVVNKAIAMGATDYLGKPVSLATFAEKLQAVLMSIGKLIMKRGNR